MPGVADQAECRSCETMSTSTGGQAICLGRRKSVETARQRPQSMSSAPEPPPDALAGPGQVEGSFGTRVHRHARERSRARTRELGLGVRVLSQVP